MMGNREWFVLDAEAREIVQKAVGLCRRNGDRIALPFRDGEVVAYPNLRSGISWDIDDRQGTLARGVQCLPADAEPRISDAGELRTMAASWDQLSDIASVRL